MFDPEMSYENNIQRYPCFTHSAMRYAWQWHMQNNIINFVLKFYLSMYNRNDNIGAIVGRHSSEASPFPLRAMNLEVLWIMHNTFASILSPLWNTQEIWTQHLRYCFAHIRLFHCAVCKTRESLGTVCFFFFSHFQDSSGSNDCSIQIRNELFLFHHSCQSWGFLSVQQAVEQKKKKD